MNLSLRIFFVLFLIVFLFYSPIFAFENEKNSGKSKGKDENQVYISDNIIGSWSITDYNNGPSDEVVDAFIVFYNNNEFSINYGYSRSIVGSQEIFNSPEYDGTIEGSWSIVQNKILKIKPYGIHPYTGNEYSNSYLFPIDQNENMIIFIRSVNQCVFNRLD